MFVCSLIAQKWVHLSSPNFQGSSKAIVLGTRNFRGVGQKLSFLAFLGHLWAKDMQPGCVRQHG